MPNPATITPAEVTLTNTGAATYSYVSNNGTRTGTLFPNQKIGFRIGASGGSVTNPTYLETIALSQNTQGTQSDGASQPAMAQEAESVEGALPRKGGVLTVTLKNTGTTDIYVTAPGGVQKLAPQQTLNLGGKQAISISVADHQ